MDFELIESSGKPIKAWTRGTQVEDAAKQQLRNLASLPFLYWHVAAMPDTGAEYVSRAHISARCRISWRPDGQDQVFRGECKSQTMLFSDLADD